MTKSRAISLLSLLRIWVFGSILLIVLGVSLILARTTKSHVSERIEFIRNTAQLYADDSISIELGRNNLVYVADGIRRLRSTLGADRIRVRGVSGEIIESTDAGEIGSIQGDKQGGDVVSLPVLEHSTREQLGTLEIIVLTDRLWRESLRAAIEPTLFTLSILAIFSLVGFWFLHSRITRPFRALLPTSGVDNSQEDHLWPQEFLDLRSRLDEAIKRRDLAVIGQLASGVIHDIKTLLHPIGTGSDLVAEQAELTEKRERRVNSLLKAISTNLPKINQLVEQTLDGSRSIPIRARNTDLVACIANSIEVNRVFAEGSGVSIEYLGPPSLVMALDPVQFERALVNLIKNGVEAARESARDPKRVQVSLENGDANEIQLQVQDSGQGFSVSGSEIFTPLRSSKPHGSGLGLLIVRKIVEAHGGLVTAEPVGALGGACFSVILNSNGTNFERGSA